MTKKNLLSLLLLIAINSIAQQAKAINEGVTGNVFAC